MIPTTDAVLEQLRRGTLEYVVLGHLEREPSYGHDLARTLGAHPMLLGSQGTLYPLLGRMRAQGWVETYLRESTAGPARRYYRLTEDGRAALAAFREIWATYSAGVDAGLTPSRT